MNSKKIPTKWEKICFSLKENQEKNVQLKLLEKNSKFTARFLSNSILKIFFSASNHALSYEKFSWTINAVEDESNIHVWEKEESNYFYESTINENNKIKTKFNAENNLIEQVLNDKSIFSIFFQKNQQKEWLSVDILFESKDYKCFGFGEETNPMDKNGKNIIFWNTDNPGYKIELSPLYQSWPIAIINDNETFYAFVFDNPAYSEIDLRIQGKLSYKVNDLQLNMFVLFGPTLKKVLEQLKYITGSILPIPKWTLGYQQSRWSYTPSKRVLEVAETFRNKKIPCDVIYLDIDYMERFKCFTFGSEFGDYHDLIDKLHSIGFKVVPIIDPGIKVEKGYFVYDQGQKSNYFIANPQGKIITIKVWPGESHFPDFTNNTVQQWWSGLVEDFVKDSRVDGIWCDMNEPSTFDARRTLTPNAMHQPNAKTVIFHEKVHNVFGFLMSKATYHGLLRLTSTPYVMTRSTYLGGQKYATTWTGDNVSTWEHLQASIPMILSLGLSGQPVVGPDIGGFNGVPDAKLYERWIVQGAFYPYSRSHTVQHSPDQEPWSFGEEVESKARKAIELRYKLLPYYYSLLYESFKKGYPIIRPLFFNISNESTLDKNYYETEFFLGDTLLFAPFMTKSSKREIYLPPGFWYPWWKKDIIYEGDSYLTIEEKDIAIIPLFFKDELIIPMNTKNIQYVPKTSQEELTLLLVFKDNSNEISYEYIEYFDQSAVFGLNISLKKETDYMNLRLEEIKQGSIPDLLFLPKKIHIQLNYFARKIRNLEGDMYEIETDKDDWSNITLLEVSYPLDVQIEILF